MRVYLSDGETSKILELSLILVVDPVVSLSVGGICRTFNLKDVISNLDGDGLDVGPEPNKLGANMNLQSQSIRKFRILRQHQIALSMVFEVLIDPSSDVWIPTSSR